MANIQQAAAASNPITDQNKAYVLAQLQAQRAQQMAQMLTEQGAAPIKYDERGPISWTQGMAKMLQAYQGRTMADDAMQQQAGVRAQGAQLMGQAYGMPGAADAPPQGQPATSGLPPGAPPDTAAGFTPPAQPAAAGPSPQALGAGLQPGRATPMNPYGAPPYIAMMAGSDPGAKAQLETFLKGQEPTNEQKNWGAQGIDPRRLAAGVIAESDAKGKTSEIQNAQYMGKTAAQMLAASLATDAKNGEIERKGGNQFKNFYTGDSGMVPHIPINANPVGAISPNGALPGGVGAIPGAQGIVASNAEQEQSGKSLGAVHTVTGSNGQLMSGTGRMLFGGGGGPAPSTAPAPAAGQPPADLNHMTPEQKKALMERASAQFGMQPGSTAGTHVIQGADPTVQTARTNQQNSMAEKWKPLNDAVTNAQTISSRLDTIKNLATKASTGQFADKMQFVNSLLSFAGSEKATDANTAKVLLDKNSNQIVAQLGSGGMATDAARAIIGSAYPNSHMPAAAIAEASDNLKAANTMMIAKAGVLQKHYLGNDPVAYQKAEADFNAAADPRIYQWKALASNPPAQAAYAAKLMKQDPSIVNRIHALEQMGALK
jgi:hypothetical protein